MKTKIYTIILASLFLMSCNKWLDVTPKGQSEATDLLTTEKGYNSTLGGVYYTLSGPQLYGKNLTYGIMDLLAKYWDISTNLDHTYYQLSSYDYKNANSVAVFNEIWKGFYTTITQCNLIISSLEQNRDAIKYSELMEGEAYGLRAFAHMELFRLFGPVIRENADLDKLSIAYRTEFNVEAQKFETGREVLAKVQKDLERALDLLKNDPINLNGRRGDSNTSLLAYNDILNRRGSRMNYYAVLGMLARLEQLKLNQDQAYVYAKRIIDECKESEVIILMDKSNMEGVESQKDLNYSREMLFGLYTNNLYEMTNDMFIMKDSPGNPKKSFPINTALFTTFMNEIYGRQPDGSGTDNRLRYWFKKRENSDYYEITKLRETEKAQGMGTAYDPEVPVLRMSEIYYIACEAKIGKDNDLALSYLNDVRLTRNLTVINGPVDDVQLKEYLMREQRKDFIGEGRMFPLYKRLFSSIYVKQGIIIEPLEQNFVFPIPDDEYEYSPNKKQTNK